MAEKIYILPYLRKGLSGFIKSSDGYVQGQNRAEIVVSVDLKGRSHDTGEENRDPVAIKRNVQLIGPSDIKRLNDSAISQVFPPSSKNQRYNAFNMPFIEFYEEDFPWRYTPLAPDTNGNLCPWLMLVAVSKDECTVTTTPNGGKVVTFNLTAERYQEVFPSEEMVKKLAHVQVLVEEGTALNDQAVNNLLEDNPEKGISRILCASKIPTSSNIAVFLLPAFESGRLGGLGESTKEVYMDDISTKNGATVFPVYFQWNFYTSSAGGTFEDLADKLEFTSDEDYGKLSANLTVDIADSGLLVTNGAPKNANGEIVIDVPAALSLKETLSSDKVALREEDNAYRNMLKEELLKSPVFTEDGASKDEDPWVVPPVYGAQHLQAQKADLDGRGTNPVIKEVNLELKHRIAAGMGSAVVRNNQESFVNRAWQKVEKINELNQIIREYCQMVEVNKNAESRRRTALQKRCGKNLRGLSSDAAIRVLSNSKRFRNTVSVETLRARINAYSEANAKKSKVSDTQLDLHGRLNTLLNALNLLNSELKGKKGFNKDVAKRISYIMNAVNDDTLISGAPSNIQTSIKNLRGCFTVNTSVQSAVEKRELQNRFYRASRSEKQVGEFVIDGKTSSGDREILENGVKYLNEAIDAIGKWMKEFDASYSQSQIKSYSDVMVPKKKRVIGITKGELDSLVDSKTWHELLEDGARLQKIANQRIDEYMEEKKWMKGLVDIVYEGKRFFFVRAKNPFIPTKNMQFINEDCSRLILAALGKITPERNRQTYGWYAQIAKQAVLSGNDIFTADYCGKDDVNCQASSFFYPVLVSVTENKRTHTGYIVDDALFVQIAKDFGSANKNPLVIKYNTRDEKTQAVVADKDQQCKLYIFPSSYKGIVYKKEYNVAVDNLQFSGEITYKYEDGSVKEVDYGVLYDPKDSKKFLFGLLYYHYSDVFNFTSLAEFNSNLRRLKDMWLLRPTAANVTVPSSVVEINADKMTLSDRDGELYSLLENKLYSITVPWSKMAKQVDEIEPDENVDIKQIEADRIGEIIEKYKDVEDAQLEDWEKFVQSKAVNSKYPVMAYPEFLEPTFFYLKELAQEYILPSAGEMKNNSITIMSSNLKFEEAFLLGMNTEMGQELLWREYPTDQRGSYFRKFWDQTTLPEMSQLEQKYYDIEKINKWNKPLGGNHKDSKSSMMVFAIKGELMKAYPKTRIYLSTINKGNRIELKYAASMSSWLSEDTYLVGFQGVTDKMFDDQKLCLTFQEEMNSIVFTSKDGLDNAANSASYAAQAQDRASIFVLPL